MQIVQPFLAIVVIGAFIGMIVMMTLDPPKADAATLQLLNTFMGILAASFSMVVSFYFGSSTASKTKDETIASLAGTGSGSNIVPPKPGAPGTVEVAGNVKGTLTEKQ